VGELPQRQATEFIATYANHVEIGASIWDFRFMFFEITEDETGNLIRERKARVVMSPQQAEAFSRALGRSVENWKRETSNLPDLPE
jgi:hypothetical protein